MNILSSETFCRDRRCLISPSTSELQYVWDSIDSRDPRALACLKNMSLRHDPKKLSTSFTSTTGYHSELVKLMTYLDRSGISLNLDGCWEEFSRPLCSPVGVDFLCRWAVTPLRSGICRVFFAARLISLISGTEVIIQSAILSFLDDCQPDKDIITNVNLLMSELVRRRCFSVPDYFRSLIASGRLSKYRDPIKVRQLSTRIYRNNVDEFLAIPPDRAASTCTSTMDIPQPQAPQFAQDSSAGLWIRRRCRRTAPL